MSFVYGDLQGAYRPYLVSAKLVSA